MGLQPLYGNGRPVLWAGAWVARGNITISGTPNCLNYWKSLWYIHSLQTWPRAACCPRPVSWVPMPYGNTMSIIYRANREFLFRDIHER